MFKSIFFVLLQASCLAFAIDQTVLAGETLPNQASVFVLNPASGPFYSKDSCASCPDSNPATTCPPNGTLGIRYGRCYTATDINGTPLTRGIAQNSGLGYEYYYFGTTYSFRAPVFRICHNQTLLSCTSPQDEYVLAGGSWFLLDQSGFQDRTDPEFVTSLLGNGGAGYYLYHTDNSTLQQPNVVDFTAKIRCLFGKCVPCVQLYSKSGADPFKTHLGLFQRYLPAYGGDAVLLANNSNACIPIIFQETGCLTSWASQYQRADGSGTQPQSFRWNDKSPEKFFWRATTLLCRLLYIDVMVPVRPLQAYDSFSYRSVSAISEGIDHMRLSLPSFSANCFHLLKKKSPQKNTVVSSLPSTYSIAYLMSHDCWVFLHAFGPFLESRNVFMLSNKFEISRRLVEMWL